MQRMQAEWREAAAKRKEKLAEEDEEAEAEAEEDEGWRGDGDGKIGGIGGKVKAGRKIKVKGKSKRKKGLATTQDNEDVDDHDPWAVIAAKRLNNHSTSAPGSRSSGLVGLHDVVLAPPKLSKMPPEKTVTSALKKGSIIGLKRQEELGAARTSVVETYRRMMNERRGVENHGLYISQ